MVSQEFIEPGQTDWASLIFFAPKKNVSLRFFFNYRKFFNLIKIHDSYPVTRLDQCKDSLVDAAIFTTIDANSGYCEVEIDEADRDRTTFTSHHGLYRFIRMPFGLKNVQGTFQRAIDVIMSTEKFQYALIYLDDIVVFSKSVEENMTQLRKVLLILEEE